MVQITIIILLNLFSINYAKNGLTIINRDISIRKKRYLTFPAGSNLVIQLSAIKAIQQIQPIPWNFLGELEFPFKLPDDVSLFKRRNKISRDRREVYTKLKEGLIRRGYDGTACLTKIICEARHLKYTQGKSMVNDIIHAIFTYCETERDYEKFCVQELTPECSFSILEFLLKETTEE